MHDIEPYYRWMEEYDSATDEHSPFYGREYSEFTFHNKVYNYFIHPRWDDFGSSTLYLKVLYCSYDSGCAIIELIGEWNDCLHDDIMLLKRSVIDSLLDRGIYQFVLLMENVMNFHGGDDDYYSEWTEEIIEHDGYILALNPLDHVAQEMRNSHIDQHIAILSSDLDFNWRKYKPADLMQQLQHIHSTFQKRLV